MKADGTPLVGSAVQFKLQIRSPGNESCLLYEELQTLNMSNSSGIFSITLNDGSGTRDDNSNIPFTNVFSNRNIIALSTASCAAGSTYLPNINDGRSFVVSFKAEDMPTFEPLPPQAVNFAPAALQALQVAGFGPNNLMRLDDAAAANNLTPLNGMQFNALVNIANGTAPYVSSSTIGGAIIPVLSAAPATPLQGAVWLNSATGSLQYYNGSSTQSLGTSSAIGTVSSGAANQLAFYNTSGSTISGLTPANNSVLLTNGSGAPAWSAVSTDLFSQYLLRTGRSGGQSLEGGTAATDNLVLDSTSSGTKGFTLINPSGGNVGIGTTTPAQALDVNGSENVAGSFNFNNANSYQISTNGYGLEISPTGAGGGSEASVSIVPSSLFAGYGTAVSSLNLFSYPGESNSSYGFVMMSGGAPAPTVNGGAGMIVGTYGNNPLVFETNNTQRFYIDQGGNTGVGTTSPATLFDVHGHVANSGAAASLGSCGAAPSISGNDTRGLVTIGTGGTTSCSVTFASSYTATPICVVSWNGSGPPTATISASATTGALMVYFSVSVASGSFSYHCLQ